MGWEEEYNLPKGAKPAESKPVDTSIPAPEFSKDKDGPQFVGGPNGKVMILENGKLREVGNGIKGKALGYPDEKVEKVLADKDISASPADMAKGALEAIRQLKKNGTKICTAIERQNRLDACKVCEWHAPRFNRCRKCGCFLEVKVSMKAWHCPIDKW